jgi:hypothetical protein
MHIPIARTTASPAAAVGHCASSATLGADVLPGDGGSDWRVPYEATWTDQCSS